MRMENLDLPWKHGAETTERDYNEILFSHPPLGRNSRKLNELISPTDLTLLDLYERERQLVAREAAAIRLEERGRKQEIVARETALSGRETVLAMKERELRLAEREQAVHEFEIRIQEQEARLNQARQNVTELENEFYRKSKQETLLTNTRERELHEREEEMKNKEKELTMLQKYLKEKEMEIEKLFQKLKDEEKSLKMEQKLLEERDLDMKVREQNVKDKEQQLKDEEKINALNYETLKQECDANKHALEEKLILFKNMEDSLSLQERELDHKRLEIQQELEKQDSILKDTANLIAEKEEEIKTFEKETMNKIQTQEEELKIWEKELQHQEKSLQEYIQDLEKQKSEVSAKQEAIVTYSQQMLQWEKQLQSRAHTLNKQAEAQEEHLRVILEKERIFEELKVTLEQKEQQYKMLVQCKEHDFIIREQNLQKIISELLHLDSTQKNPLYQNVTTLSKPTFALTHEYGDCCKLPTKFLDEEISTVSEVRNCQEPTNLKKSFQNPERDIKMHTSKGIISSSQKFEQNKIFSNFHEKQLKQLPAMSRKNTKSLSVMSPDYYKEQNQNIKEKYVSGDSHLQSHTSKVLPQNSFTLTKEQIQLLEKIKNDSFKKEENLQVFQSHTIRDNLSKEKSKNIKSVEKFNYSSDSDRLRIGHLKSFLNNLTQRKPFNILPEKKLPEEKESSEISSYSSQTPTQMKSRSTSCDDLRQALDRELKEQNNLHGATKNYCMEMIHSLVEQQGVNVDSLDCESKTALHWAAQSGNLALVQYLGKMGASVDAKSVAGHTALHLAALEGRLDVVQYLIETLGADIDAQDLNGEKALHLAAGAGWLEVVKYISGVKASLATRTPITKNVPKVKVELVL